MEFFHKKTNFPFMATRKVWYTLSTVLMLVSLRVVLHARPELRHRLHRRHQRRGGVSRRTRPIDRIREAVEGAGYHEPQVQTFGSTRDVTIRLQSTGETAEVLRPKFQTILAKIDPQVVISDLAVVGPQVGDELRNSAIVSLAVTLVLIALYIILRFHTWRLSLGAILAVMHDPILVLGVFSITQTPFDLPVVAAILAVIGYSLNDTVIVFDRIRENFETQPAPASRQ